MRIFLLLPSCLYLCLLISRSNCKGKNSWQHLFRRIYMVSIMKFWIPLLMMFLCMVLLSVLGGVKERYSSRWWGWIEDQKGMTGLCLFLDKWRSIVPDTSDPGLTSLDHLLKHLCIDTFLQTEIQEIPKLRSFNVSSSNLKSINDYVSAFRYIP